MPDETKPVTVYLRPAWTARAMASSRRNGAVGRDPLCYRRARTLLDRATDKQLRVLDFGAGKGFPHTKELRKRYAPYGHTVVAYDLHEDGCSDYAKVTVPSGNTDGTWDVVIASNVLNVIEEFFAFGDTLQTLVRLVTRHGCLIVNYPSSPRYLENVKLKHFRSYLEKHFECVQQGPGGVFICFWPIR